MNEPLKPCGLCGNCDDFEFTSKGNRYGNAICVTCSRCKAKGPPVFQPSGLGHIMQEVAYQAIEGWNTRPIEDELRRKLEAAINDIPHRCWKCKHSRCNTGNECDLAHYNWSSDNCLSWEWRGSKEG